MQKKTVIFFFLTKERYHSLYIICIEIDRCKAYFQILLNARTLAFPEVVVQEL